MEYTTMSTILPPPPALSPSLLPPTTPPPSTAIPPPPLPPPPHITPSSPLTTSLPPPAPPPGHLDDLNSDSDRVQVWLAQQSQLGLDFGQAEEAHSFGQQKVVDEEEERAFGAEEYAGYAVDEKKGVREEERVMGQGVKEEREGEEEKGVEEAMYRLGLGLRGGQAEAEKWKEWKEDETAQEEGRRIPGTPHSHPLSPGSSTESSAPSLSPSRADSPVLGFPSSESLLLHLPPALGRGLSPSIGARRKSRRSGAASDAHVDDARGGYVARDDGEEEEEEEDGGSSSSAVADPLRRPARHYVRALPEDPEAAAAALAREDRYTLYAGVGGGDAYGDVGVYAFEAAYEYADAGVVLGSMEAEVTGVDKPLPTLPARSRSSSPRPAAEAQGASTSTPASAPAPAMHETQGVHAKRMSTAAPEPPNRSSPPSQPQPLGRGQSRRNSNAGGVLASARQAQFPIGPGPGAAAPAAAARRVSQSSVLGVVGGGGGSPSVPTLSRRPSLLRMLSSPLPLLGERAEPSAAAAVATEPTPERPAPVQTDDTYELPQVQPQYHLPMGMQVRRARSAMLLASTAVAAASAAVEAGTSPSTSPTVEATAAEAEAGPLSMSSSLSSLSLLQPPAAQAPPTPSPIVQSSPLPPSAPPTRRSRAGSLGAAMALSPYNQQGLHGHAPSTESISIASGIRDAVYIDSAEVRARLDRLLAGLEVEGVDDGEVGDVDGRGSSGCDGQGGEEEEMGEEELGMPGYTLAYVPESAGVYVDDDDVDPDATNALRTPPSSAMAGVYRKSTLTSRAPPNTPMTPSYSAIPSYNAPPLQQHKAQRSHASLHSLRSSGSRGSSGGSAHGGSHHGSRGGSHGSLSVSLSSSGSLKRQHPYQHAQASASQVYVGLAAPPAPPSSQSQSQRHSRGHSSQYQQHHARTASGGSSSKRNSASTHSRAPSQGQGQGGQSRSRASSVAHSRAASRSRPVSVQQPLAAGHSRTSSAAHSRSGSVVPLLAQQPPTPPMHIPVPVPVRAAATGSTRPTRPPPAPPLDVAALELGPRGVGGEERVDEVVGAGLDVGAEDVVKGVDAEVMVDMEGGREEEEEVEETSEDERERLQFLRGLGLEDRMKEFEGVEFPSGLDDDEGAEHSVERHRMEYDDVRDHDHDHGSGKFGTEQTEFLAAQNEFVNENRVLAVASDERPDTQSRAVHPEMQRSMSRWSLGSSTMDDPPEDFTTIAGPIVGKKERKRKSFASPFGLGGGNSGDAIDGSTLSASTGASSPTGMGSGKEKKRGRLASFISRLSGVGVNGTLPSTPISPPLPPLPTSPNLLPSPLIIEASLRKMQSKENVVGVVPGAWEPRPLQHSWEYPAPPKLKKQQQQPSSPPLSKSVPSSPAGRVRNLPLPLPQVNVSANGNGKAPSAQDVIAGSLSVATGRKVAARMVAWEASTSGDVLERNEKTAAAARSTGLRARANTSGDLLLLANGARRPGLYKSASASVLGPAGVQRTPLGQRRTPVPIHTGISPYSGSPMVVVDDSLSPTPSSIASTEIEDEEDEEEDEEDYGVEVHQRSRARREQEHEERWARLKMANDVVSEGYRSYHQQALPPIPQSPPPPSLVHSSSVALIESTLKALAHSPSITSLAAQQGLQPASPETRQRLKSMPSLTLASAHQATAAATTSPPASAPTTNFSHAPSIVNTRSGKGSGFRGFVERMGLVGSAANSMNSSVNNSPSSLHPSTPLYPGTPLSTVPLQLSIPGSDATSLGQFVPSSSATANSNRSPSHSPTASLSLGGSHKESGVFTPGGLLGKKKPKRKLVISGVAPENVQGYEAVKKWCEAFGEVREMTRAPSGKLYVDFKKASVAETVCRIQAQVFIKGAGSVSLSWYTKKKPL